MFPMEFDHTILNSLPLPGEEGVNRVTQLLEAIIIKRVLPHFKKKKGTDPILAAKVAESVRVRRLEDGDNRVRCVSLVSREDKLWTINVHERVFDYLAFVIPTDPQSRLGSGTTEEHKMLAFAEFMVRHQTEHLAYPEKSEREVIRSDAEFAMGKRVEDPTFYRMLRRALEDEMNGLKGSNYLALIDQAERGRSLDKQILAIVNSYVAALGDLPDGVMERAFPCLDTDLKTRVLGICYRRSRDTTYSLLKRTYFLHKLLRLFDLLLKTDDKEAEVVFNGFKDRWGLVSLLHELDLPETSVEDQNVREVFQLFKRSLKQFSADTLGMFEVKQVTPTAVPITIKPAGEAAKSLKDRIEEVRTDPCFPSQVMEVLDKNKLNAVGHSGSKYTELLETLLAIPWGKFKRINVSPEAFEDGLDDSHYGLHKPKEIICDFFSNLIWRYKRFRESDAPTWRRNGSAFLFVGPPGVGKTSLAISVAENLGIPYHRLSLGGMRDEADLRGHSFTYEGSKPGAIVQGIIKMGVMNGMFIMDEADKTEKFAIATLLEILDPEQNYLFHDKYTQTTVDIDLSNFHFVLTANTLETVPPTVINRCEVIVLDRYSMDEKVEIAKSFLIQRVRERYEISENRIFIDPKDEDGLLRYLIKTYTHEAGVRELERIIRTLFLRIMRKEVLTSKFGSVRITREKVKGYLEAPPPLRRINEDDRVGEMMGLGINVELGIGSVIPIQATEILMGSADRSSRGFLSMIHATGNIQKIMDESRKVATTAILYRGPQLGISIEKAECSIHLHFMGGSTPKDGPSAGGAVALALTSVLTGKEIRRDVAMTGEIDTQGRITRVGALDLKLETAVDAGCKTLIIPRENCSGEDGIERLPEALKQELQLLTYEQWKGDHEPFDYERQMLQIVAVDDILQAVEIAFIDPDELSGLEALFDPFAERVAAQLAVSRQSPRQHLRVMYVKDPGELDRGGNTQTFRWEDAECQLLVSPGAGQKIADEYPSLAQRRLLRDFDPSSNNVASILTELAQLFGQDTGIKTRLSFLGPFFFFVRDMIQLQAFSPGPSFETLRMFANNFTVQGVKIKACKPVLNRLYYLLCQLEDGELERCPFLAKKDEVYVVDMSFIPEKYRLDTARAEKILNQVLNKWLSALESRLAKADLSA